MPGPRAESAVALMPRLRDTPTVAELRIKARDARAKAEAMAQAADELTYMARKLNAVGKALVEAHGEAQSAALRESSSQVHSLFSLILSTTISPHDPKTRGTP